MDTRVLFALKQGPRSLENHIREFLACAHYSDLPDIILNDIFCDGINQPLQTQLRCKGPRSSLSCFLEFALLTVGSLLTVGVADEDRDTASCHKMTADPEPHDSPAKPESALTRPAKLEFPARMATTPTDAPLWPGLITSVLDLPLVSVPGARRVRSRGRSVPGARRVRSRGRSVPGARRVRSRGRSVPGARRVRSRGRSVPGARRVRSRGRSVPGARRVRSQSSLQRPLRSKSSQSPALRVPSWFHPAHQSPCWFRPAPQSPCWPHSAHLRLHWFLPVQRLPSAPRLSTSRIPPDVRASRVPP